MRFFYPLYGAPPSLVAGVSLPLLEGVYKGFDEYYRPSIIVFSKIKMEQGAFERLEVSSGTHI
jgi:hypothetical protein